MKAAAQSMRMYVQFCQTCVLSSQSHLQESRQSWQAIGSRGNEEVSVA